MASPAFENRFVDVWCKKQVHGIAIGNPDHEMRGLSPNVHRPTARTSAKLAKRLFNLRPPMLSAIADLVTHTATAQTKPADSTQRVFLLPLLVVAGC
jgi:hypothetical protein